MASKTFTVTVQSTGGGNKYFIDGVQQKALTLFEGSSYRFDQSDSSNATHPLRLSTTSDGTHNSGSEYTTGVTTNGTPGQAGAYTEITVADNAPTLYYYCSSHSGMGGQALTEAPQDFTITVVSTGGGNKYFVDGVQQATLKLAKGAAYRLDQSAGSNGGHPLRFSTTNDGTHGGGSEYTVGITTNGSAGYSGAYTQILVADDAPSDLYYYCTNHSGMGGAAYTYSNAWGALEWNQGSWAAQGDVGLSVTGNSFTSAIGNATAEGIIQVGWGGDTWGENEWGDLSGSQPTITGVSMSSAIGSETVTADANVTVSGLTLASAQGEEVAGISFLFEATGLSISSAIGQAQHGIGAIITGISMSATIGVASVDESELTGIGWGRKRWGNLAWGGAYSVIPTGQQITSAIGSVAASADHSVSVTTAGQITMTQGSHSEKIDQDIFVQAASDQLDGFVGSPEVGGLAIVDVTGVSMSITTDDVIAGLKTPVDVTGVQATLTQGNTSLVQTTVEPVSGLSATMALGQHAEIPGQVIGVSGLQITSALGEEAQTANALVTPTGIVLTSSVGNSNVTPWSEVDLGVNNSWQPVDLAA